jgi:hypothetical protein
MPPLRLTVHKSPAYEKMMSVLFMAGFCRRCTVPAALNGRAAAKNAKQIRYFIANLQVV